MSTREMERQRGREIREISDGGPREKRGGELL